MLIRGFLTALALPPAINLVLIVLGLLISLRFRRLGRGIAVLGLVSLMVLALPWVKMKIYEDLESYPALDLTTLAGHQPAAGAIVLLGGGMVRFAQEYQHMQLTDGSVRRILYAATVARQSALPVLITGGGRSLESPDIEAARMGNLLEQLGVVPRWLETESRTTWENAVLSAPILRAAGIDTVVLVTDAWHMRRSVMAFEAQGLTVIPAPTAFRNGAYHDIRAFVPDRNALDQVGDALREWLGIVTYRLVYADIIDRTAAAPAADGSAPAPTR